MKIDKDIEKISIFYDKYKEKFKILNNYIKWFCKKLIINFKHKWPKYTKKWDIWLCYLWINIDWEQDWDLEHFIRPVFILKSWWEKVKHVTILPLTTNFNKDNKFFYKLEKNKYTFLDKDSSILLDKIKIISKKRLIWKKLWKIKIEDYNSILEKTISLLK